MVTVFKNLPEIWLADQVPSERSLLYSGNYYFACSACFPTVEAFKRAGKI
jgi:hypothetical protein